MSEREEKDAKDLQVKKRVIITVAMIMVFFGVLYVACRMIGGAFKDFAEAAAPWIFLGVGLAGTLAYSAAGAKNEDNSQS